MSFYGSCWFHLCAFQALWTLIGEFIETGAALHGNQSASLCSSTSYHAPVFVSSSLDKFPLGYLVLGPFLKVAIDWRRMFRQNLANRLQSSPL